MRWLSSQRTPSRADQRDFGARWYNPVTQPVWRTPEKHNDVQPTRHEFLHISFPEKVLFYVLIFASLAWMVWQFVGRVQLWQKGRPLGELQQGWRYWVPTREAVVRWTGKVAEYVLLQKKVRSSRPRSGAPMHLMIFYGFLAMFVATSLLALATYGPVNFHRGAYYVAYETVFDLLGLLLLFGLLWALGRRLWADKTPLTREKGDLWALALLLTITITGYWLEAARISVDPQPWDGSSVVGYALAQVQGPMSPMAYKAVWWFHMVWIAVFFAVLPRMRLRHILMAVASTAAQPDRPMGHLRTISMEEVEQTEQVGVKLAKDYSRWHLMSLDACMECGRCTEVCPAWNVGKVLNPKRVVQDVRTALETGQEVASTVSEEALWACTTCNACVEACPVTIRHVDLIVDARRNLVSEGALSGTAAVMLRQTASTDHAWGAARGSREEWMKGLDIPLCRDGVEFDYLFWVGCAGATDPGAIKTTKAVAELLKKAGVKFACLGNEEACTGDPARRVGEEFLFQEKAMGNAAVFEAYGVKRVVTACPHCLNTFKNEYGEFGAKLEVFHHSQLLQQLVRKGDLVAATPPRGEVAYHDPCYLSRVNGEAEAPREIVAGMANPEFHSAKTRCCGAGGGRMWMEESPDQRPANARADQVLATGAKTVAVGCPFCRIMLGDSLKQARPDEEIRLVDLAEMLQEANRAPRG